MPVLEYSFNQTNMKHIYLILSFIAFVCSWTGCIEDPEMDTRLQNAKAPTVKAPEKDYLSATATSLVVKACVEKENGSVVTEKGVCWSKENQATPAENMWGNRYLKAEEGGLGEFTIEISELDNHTTYYVYTYAINAVDTAYSEGVAYATIQGIGSVITLKPQEESICATSALLKGVIPASDRGESEITDRGFYLSIHPNPTETDSVYHAINKTIDPLVNDTFVYHVKSLKPDTKYYVLAYAKNKFGVYPSKVDSFMTTDGKPKVSLVTKDSIGFTNAFLSAQLLSEGDSAITAFGFCWGITENPTIENDTIICIVKDGTYRGELQNLDAHKQYYARAYATNCFGTSYSEEPVSVITLNELPTIQTTAIPADSVRNGMAIVGGELQNKGMSPVTTIGICWSTTNKTPSLTTGDHMIEVPLENLDEKGKFTLTLENIKGNVTYYVRAYAINGSATPGYGDVQSFKGPSIFTAKNIYEGANRSFSASFSLNNQAYIIGGDKGNECSNELLGYNVEKNEWIPLTSFIKACYQMSACTDGSVAYVVGGTDKFNILGECQTYHPSDNTWATIQSLEENAPRYDAISFFYKDSLYLLGGVNKKGNSKEIWRYNNLNNDWKMVIDSFPVAQRRGIALVANGIVYAGLGETSGASLRKGFWVSTGNLTEWTSAPGTLPNNISTISAGIYYKIEDKWDSFFMIDDNSIIWEYRLSDNVWKQRAAFPYRMKNYHMFVLNNQIYILGQDLYNTNQFMIYDPIWDN